MWLAAALLAIVYFTAFLASFNTGVELVPDTIGRLLPGGLVAILLLAPIVSLVLVAISREPGDLPIKVLLSFVAAFGGAVVFVLLGQSLGSSSGGIFSLGKIAVELSHAYWPAFALLFGLVALWIGHPSIRARAGSLSVLPLLQWGWQSSLSLSRAFHSSHMPPELFWCLALVSVVALVLILFLLMVLTAIGRAPGWTRATQVAVFSTVLAVLCDWGFTLFLISDVPGDSF